MNDDPDTLLVACLCAEWCGTCRDYRSAFDRARRGPGAWHWVDVEDDDELVGEIDVENFPTLLIARGAQVLFFGTVTPHAATLQHLVERATAGELNPVSDAAAQALTARLRALS